VNFITLLVLYSIGVAILTFVVVLFLGTYIAGAMGPGHNDIGHVIIGVYILCGLLVGCTYAIIETIRKVHEQ